MALLVRHFSSALPFHLQHLVKHRFVYSVRLAYWEDLLPGHGGALEEQGPGRGRDACVPPFKMPSMEVSSLCHEDVMRDGYQPKMLLFALDELFYIYDQIKKQRRPDKKIIVAYEILCLSTNRCTD